MTEHNFHQKTWFERLKYRWEDNIKTNLKEILHEVTGEGPVADSYEHGNEPSGSITDMKFLYHLSNYQLVKKNLSLCPMKNREFLNQLSDNKLLNKNSAPWS